MPQRGRLGRMGRVWVKCANCGVRFSITPTMFRMKQDSANPNFFHVRNCYTEWRKKQAEAKKHGV